MPNEPLNQFDPIDGPSLPFFPTQAEDDPWRHRSEGMRCRTCMWFVPKSAEIGRCRKRAPNMGGFPVVYPNDWCGDHRLDETKVGP